MDSKRNVRTCMKKLLQTMSQSDYCKRSACIAESLYQESEWRQAQIIGITVSIFPEVETKAIIAHAWSQGKKVAVPKCEAQLRQMDFRILTDFSQLECVYSGLLEPRVDQTVYVPQEELDLLIVPGLAFDVRGHRLGFGGGYYDRYLSRYTGNTLSLAFKEQVITHFPTENHDLPIGKIITEEQIFECLNNEME